jgi:hypothetical protein
MFLSDDIQSLSSESYTRVPFLQREITITENSLQHFTLQPFLENKITLALKYPVINNVSSEICILFERKTDGHLLFPIVPGEKRDFFSPRCKVSIRIGPRFSTLFDNLKVVLCFGDCLQYKAKRIKFKRKKWE